jgi:sortase A
MRRNVQILAWTFIWSGIFISGYLAWQLFVTDIFTRGVQVEAQAELDGLLEDSTAVTETIDVDQPPLGSPKSVNFTPETAPDRGEPFAFLRIPEIGVDQVVFAGVDVETLKSGPGHMEGTPVPGQPGNAVISGHRTTYGRPFFDFDLLEPGDRIEVESASGIHVYEVRELAIVQPTDVWVTDARPGGWLTLTTCNPKFSAKERLIVSAEMVAGPNYDYITLHKAGLVS